MAGANRCGTVWYGVQFDAPFTGGLPLAELRHLDPWQTKLGNDGLAHLDGLTNLEMLDLAETRINDDGLKHLSGLKKLDRLSLQDTRVSDAGIPHLKWLTSLRLLTVESTKPDRVAYRTPPPRRQAVHEGSPEA